MATVQTEIWLALKSRIKTLPFSPAVPVAYPASVFTPGSGPFIAVGRTNAAPERVFVGKGDSDRAGTLTLVYAAKLGQDAAVYEEAAGTIAAHFAEDTKMRFGSVCVRVTSAPHVVSGYQDDGWFRTPVNIPWFASA